jgi:hypothetical protein
VPIIRFRISALVLAVEERCELNRIEFHVMLSGVKHLWNSYRNARSCTAGREYDLVRSWRDACEVRDVIVNCTKLRPEVSAVRKSVKGYPDTFRFGYGDRSRI